MKSLLFYLTQVTACAGILYGYYHFFLRNKKFHVYNRFYLLIAATLSILIPFLDIPVYFTTGEANGSFVLKTITSISSGEFNEPSSAPVSIKHTSITIAALVWYCYILIATVMIARLLVSLEKIRQIKRKYPVQKLNRIYFLNTNEPGTPFSFFRWMFLGSKDRPEV